LGAAALVGLAPTKVGLSPPVLVGMGATAAMAAMGLAPTVVVAAKILLVVTAAASRNRLPPG